MSGPFFVVRSGSGRWQLHTKATTVEDCRELDLGKRARDGAFVPWHVGSLRWLRGEEATASIDYTVRPVESDLLLVLSYTFTATGQVVEEPVPLVNTPMRFGGVRWWGRCPLVVDGRACGRRVRKLYLPPGGRYFGCRTCYRLTYASAQTHDKRVDFLRRNPEALAAIVNNPAGALDGRLILALKALR
jgi:hypothetical protein